jgi:hypothetical protein
MAEIKVKIDHPETGQDYFDFSFQLPENLDGMDTNTFVNWCALVDAGYEVTELKVRAFLMFARLDLTKLAMKAPGANPLEMFAPTLELFEPLINQNACSKDFFTNSGIRIFEDLKGPGDFLHRVSFKQYGLADHCFLLYLKHEKENDLNEFCSSLFTIGKQKFDEEALPEVIHKFGQIPKTFKKAIFHNYWLMRNWQKSVWPLAFGDDGKGTELQTDKKEFILTDWDGLAVSVAQSGVFGTKVQVDNTPANEILKFMHDQQVFAKKQKSKSKNG